MRAVVRPPIQALSTFDSETTGVNIENARIVTAFFGVMDATTGEITERYPYLVNPGRPIPAQATAVHGITDEQARNGMNAKEGVFEISKRLDILSKRALPMVIMNAPYDISLLDREMRRHWSYRIKPFVPYVVLDPYVIDKHLDPYRRGKRKLVDLAAQYGVEVRADAHDAEADCWMAGQVMLKMLEHPKLRDMQLFELHKAQVQWKAEQMQSLRTYFQKNDRDWSTIREEWPLIPYEDPAYDPDETD